MNDIKTTSSKHDVVSRETKSDLVARVVSKQSKMTKKNATASRTRSIAFVGLTIAIMAVSAWVTIPLGPIPFTLQIFAFAFAILVLTPRECLAAAGGYLLIGAIGIPVFSGMRGGIGVLLGPTGGFLWGYFLGVLAALGLLYMLKKFRGSRGAQHKAKNIAIDIVGALMFLMVAYVCGWLQYMAVAGVGPVASFVTTVAPFVVLDIVKVVAAVFCAQAVRLGLSR